jgi:2-methylisocitrate lyase-like PEP mutase family enzyme
MANMIEGGATPVLAPRDLEDIGYKLVAYPVTLLEAAVDAMKRALSALDGHGTMPPLVDFDELKRVVGFDDYDTEAALYLD